MAALAARLEQHAAAKRGECLGDSQDSSHASLRGGCAAAEAHGTAHRAAGHDAQV